ncbi:unnamed protein product [Peronospora belbahrii]|uniref:PX domain-containing protein n=1 Tax=Peronospora belbahrii TaxID=622444 RepID=A0AAU9KTB9_9STRA|nr:unnamed protein product [Peronospora belbahrii]
MNSSTNELSASITSALALKPSTVYILRVMNNKTRQSWHIRRCFSEFCELREKLLALIDDQMATYLTSLEVDNVESSIYNTKFNISSSVSSYSSYRGGKYQQYSAPLPSDRFCYVFKHFPPRKLFGSRSKRVIEARCLALNRFLQQALDVVEVVRQRRLTAICFSMMTHIECFLESKAHQPVARVAPSCSVGSTIDTFARQEPTSPSAATRTSAVVSLTPGFHNYPLVPTRAFTMTQNDHRRQSNTSQHYCSTDSDDDGGSNEEEAQRFNNFDFTQRFYREFGRRVERAPKCSDDLDDDDEMQIIKKTWSAMSESDFRERKLHHSGSHFSMLESGHMSIRTSAKRIEIASIHYSDVSKAESKPIRKTSQPAFYRRERQAHRSQASYRVSVQPDLNEREDVNCNF